jgi:hypothetical protein
LPIQITRIWFADRMFSRTRAADLARRIEYERSLNDAHVAQRNRPPPF